MIYELALEQLSLYMFPPGIVTRLKQLSEDGKKHEGRALEGAQSPPPPQKRSSSALFHPIFFSLNPNGWPKLASSINRPTPRPQVLDKKKKRTQKLRATRAKFCESRYISALSSGRY